MPGARPRGAGQPKVVLSAGQSAALTIEGIRYELINSASEAYEEAGDCTDQVAHKASCVVCRRR